MKQDTPLRIGLAGIGTVGAGVLKIFAAHGARLSARSGRTVEIRAVCARNRSRDRGVDITDLEWEDDPVALARREDLDLIVEVMGGQDGPAKAAAEAALGRGAHFVTANKAMMAVHGAELAALAERSGANLRFEAAVAGGVPIVKALGEGLGANAMRRVYGVLNGTCNYILTEMARTGRDYADILHDAQDLGYAEADPTADVGGFDAAQKLALLAALAFGAKVDYPAVAIEGIERIALFDINSAKELGYRVKLVAAAERIGDAVIQRVAPCLLPADSAIGGLDGVTNAVVCDGDFIGQTVFEGPGAGEGPTASAIVADILDVAAGNNRPTFGLPSSALKALERLAPDEITAPYYLRLSLNDKPGVLAQVCRCLGDHGVSIHHMRQFGGGDEPATVLITTHDVADRPLRESLSAISNLEPCRDEPVALRILEP